MSVLPLSARLTARERKALAFDFAAGGRAREGEFEGYASVFGVADEVGDAVMPGAFRRSLRAKGAGNIKLLYQHEAREPIGVWRDIYEDSVGLHVRGRLVEGVSRAREVLALMRAGALDGLSIGYQVVRARRDAKTGLRLLVELDLWEISIVTFPLLRQARITRVKRAHDSDAALASALRGFAGKLASK
jgi:HK97 family phage prohead protease